MQSGLLWIGGTMAMLFAWAAFELAVEEPHSKASYRFTGLVLMVLGALFWRVA